MNNLKIFGKNLVNNKISIFSSNKHAKSILFNLPLRSFAFSLNPFSKSKSNSETSISTSRLAQLQNKFKDKKGIKSSAKLEVGESVEETREIYAQKSFDRFLKYLENKDIFTWQNNLELLKVYKSSKF